MDKRLKKLNKSLRSLQDLVNAMETVQLEKDYPRKSDKMPDRRGKYDIQKEQVIN